MYLLIFFLSELILRTGKQETPKEKRKLMNNKQQWMQVPFYQ